MGSENTAAVATGTLRCHARTPASRAERKRMRRMAMRGLGRKVERRKPEILNGRKPEILNGRKHEILSTKS
jgi:hypothetical protein